MKLAMTCVAFMWKIAFIDRARGVLEEQRQPSQLIMACQGLQLPCHSRGALGTCIASVQVEFGHSRSLRWFGALGHRAPLSLLMDAQVLL